MSFKQSYHDRIQNFPNNSLVQSLLQLIESKKSNLCVAVDLHDWKDVEQLIHQIGPHICLLKVIDTKSYEIHLHTNIDVAVIQKTHIDILKDFTPSVTHQLTILAEKYQFLLFEDRKFADIGNTVQHQYQGGIYNIASWAHFTNAHPISGPGIIHSLQNGLSKQLLKQRAMLLIAEMSSKKSMATQSYTENTLQMAQQEDPNRQWLVGFIATGRLIQSPDYLWLTPGVQEQNIKSDALDQQYQTPEHVLIHKNSDIIIVGRGVYAATNPAKAAQHFQHLGWNAYLKRISQS